MARTQVELTRSWFAQLFSTRGRLSQRAFVTNIILATAILGAIALASLWAILQFAEMPNGTWGFRAAIAAAIGSAGVLLWIRIALQVRRLHDRDRPWWWVFLLAIPIVSIWISIEIFILNGNLAANRYGSPTTTFSKPRSLALIAGLGAFVLVTFGPAVIARSTIAQTFNAESASQEPSLLYGDYFFASKTSYGYSRYSFPLDLVSFSGRIFSSPPQRGDVVVFRSPTDIQTSFVKRVVGLPGDTVQMRSGILYIAGKPIPRRPVVSPDQIPRHMRYRETLPNGVSYDVFDDDPNSYLDNTIEFFVPPDHYFVLGDNRDNSDDSRASVGFVPFENFIGKAVIIYFSIDGSADDWHFWDWPKSIRLNRIGNAIR